MGVYVYSFILFNCVKEPITFDCGQLIIHGSSEDPGFYII